jgi:hypothetical protein
MSDRWIWKGDAGAERDIEAEKSNASDARKRSGFCWGIGRELYTAPFIWIPKGLYKAVEKEKNGKNVIEVHDKFVVKSMQIKDKKIVSLLIYNENLKKDVYSYGMNIQAGVDYEVDYAKQCGIYTKTLAQMTGKTEKEIKAEAVKRAGGKEIEKLYEALAQMISENKK